MVRRFALAGVLLAGLACAGDKEGTPVMHSAEQIAGDVLAMDDPSFFERDKESINDLAWDSMEYEFVGIAASAPTVVDCAVRSTLPVVVLKVEDGARVSEIDEALNTTALAVDLHDGTVRMATMFPVDPSKQPLRKPDPEEPEDDAAEEPDEGRGATRVDYRALLDLPWTSGRYALRVLEVDWVSNAPVVELRGPDGAAARTSFPVEEALEIGRAARRAGAPPFPSFEASSDTPGGEGALAIDLPREVASGAPSIPVFGRLRVPAPAGSIVRSTGPRDPDLPACVIRATVVVTEKDRSSPRRVDLRIPVFSDGPIEPGDVVEAAFAIDLVAEQRQPILPKTYFVYLVVGEHLAGPVTLVVNS